MNHRTLFAVLALAIGSVALAADWPQFRGPNRDDVSTEKGLLPTWPADGPPLLWSTKGLGGGFSSVSIMGERIYTLGNKNDVTNVVALNRDTGKIVWESKVGKAGGSLGCTPTVDGDHVYALGQQGDLVCLETATGKRVWQHNLVKEFGGHSGGWQYCESPLIDGDRLICTPGGDKATMLALNKKTGAVIWKCVIPLKHGTTAGYSSVVIATVGKVRHYVQLLSGGLVGVGMDGKLLWTNEGLVSGTANIPTPIVLGDRIFGSVGYGPGGGELLKLTADGDKVTAEKVYFNEELKNKHGGVVVVDGYVYGDTDDSGHPFCAEVKTGKRLWKREGQGMGRGSASVTYADGHLYFHYTNGIVALVKASPKAYEEVGSFKVPKQDDSSWAHPVVVGGRLYLREGDYLYCYDVRAKG